MSDKLRHALVKEISSQIVKESKSVCVLWLCFVTITSLNDFFGLNLEPFRSDRCPTKEPKAYALSHNRSIDRQPIKNAKLIQKALIIDQFQCKQIYWQFSEANDLFS